MKIARFFWPGFVVALLGLPVALALLTRVPNVNDFEMVQGAPGPSTFVALGNTAHAGGIKTAQKALWQSGPRSLLSHDEVRLLIVTYGANLTLVRGEIRVPGTACVYETAPGAALVNAAYLAFTRTPACLPFDGDRRQLDLVVTFRGTGHVGLATYFVPPAASDPNWLTLTAPDPSDPRPVAVVRGRYVDHLEGAPTRRADLLGYVWHLSRWRLSDSSFLIWAMFTLAMGAVFAGTIIVGVTTSSSWPTLRKSVGVGSVGLGLALLYVVIVPPLQAPDEPDHVLDFAQVAGRPDLEDSLASLAKRDHFERIHFFPAEHFRAIDVDHPFAVAWGPDVFAQPVIGRSVTTWLWWRLLAPALQRLSASESILALRLANALVFALCLGLATALLVSTSDAEIVAPHAVCLALLLVPTLPFFATHVSEFALLTSEYVLVAAMGAALIFDGGRTYLLGLPLGLVISLVLASGRSALPFAATFAAIIAGRALLGSSQAGGGNVRRSLIFWGGLALGLMMFGLLSTEEFRRGLWPGDTGPMPVWFRSGAELFRRRPWFVVMATPVGFGIERAMSWGRRRLPASCRLAIWSVRLVTWTAALAIVGSLVASLVVPFSVFSVIEGNPAASAGAYAARVVWVAVTGLRAGPHDHLLSASFWEGFGWLETLPGDGFVSLLVFIVSAAAVALLVYVGRAGQVRRAAWLAILTASWFASLVLYAVSDFYLHRNVHGRYLVGLYLSMLGAVWSVLGLLPRASHADTTWYRRFSREWLLVALAGGIHAYALTFILGRYF